jgi:hypothetical protein
MKGTNKVSQKASKQAKRKSVEQPETFTPGLSKAMVRQHAYELYRDKLHQDEPLTLEDWVLAEKDLVQSMDSDNTLK